MSTIKANTISPIGSTLTLGAPVAGLSVASGITVGGIGYFSSGVSFASTTDTAGVARFASGVTFSGTIDCVGVARFASTSTFTGLVTLTGGATSAAVISCGTAPTQGQHLANKTYVDSVTRVGSVIMGSSFTDYAQFIGWTIESISGWNGGSYRLTPPAGTSWRVMINYRSSGSGSVWTGAASISSITTFPNNLSNTDQQVLFAIRLS